MKFISFCIIILPILFFDIVVPAEAANVSLVDGQNDPTCRGVEDILKNIPLSRLENNWLINMPPSTGISQPEWKSLNAQEHISELYDFAAQRRILFLKDHRPETVIRNAIKHEVDESVKENLLSIDFAEIHNIKIQDYFQQQSNNILPRNLYVIRISRSKNYDLSKTNSNKNKNNNEFGDWAYMISEDHSSDKQQFVLINNGNFSQGIFIFNNQILVANFPTVFGKLYVRPVSNNIKNINANQEFVSVNKCQLAFHSN